jgi:hypothetical protein
LPAIGNEIRRLIDSANVVVNRPAAETGLTVLEAGVIAYEGNWPGAEAFVSFDRKAVQVLAARGFVARLVN